MLKRITLLARRQDLSAKAFRDHWQGSHAKLALSLPGVCKYVQNRIDEVLMTYPEAGAFNADGIVELFFTNAELMQVAQASETGAVEIPEDELRFLRGWSLNIVETTDPHDHAGAKVVVPLALKDEGDIENAKTILAGAARDSTAIQLSFNTVVSSHSRPRLWSEPVSADIIMVMWFESSEQARTAFDTASKLRQAIISVSKRSSVYLCDPLTIK